MAKFIFSFVLFIFTIHISSENYMAWKIGKKDQGISEVKLDPYGYSKYNEELGIRPVMPKTGNFDNLELKISDPAKSDSTISKINILKATTEPALVYGKNKEIRQYTTIQIDNRGKPQNVHLQIDGVPYEQIKLATGINLVETSVPETREKRDVKLSIASGNDVLAEYTIKSYPVKYWTVYMIQHSHTDIGFTKPQTEVLADHM